MSLQQVAKETITSLAVTSQGCQIESIYTKANTNLPAYKIQHDNQNMQ